MIVAPSPDAPAPDSANQLFNVQDDGNLVVYDAASTPTWYSGTVQPA